MLLKSAHVTPAVPPIQGQAYSLTCPPPPAPPNTNGPSDSNGPPVGTCCVRIPVTLRSGLVLVQSMGYCCN